MSDREIFLREYTLALAEDGASVLVGAGTSMAAGYPSWKGLLREIAGDLGLEIEDVDDLTAVAQWAIGADHSNRTTVLNAIREQIEPDHAIPSALLSLARLPIREVWTTNYDRLIERAFGELGRPVDVRANQDQLALRKRRAGAVRIYKMHGTIDAVDDLVISTEDYELYRQRRGAFLGLLHAHLTGMTFLFVGMSLTDPNVRHVLALLREHFPTTPPRHFMIARRPQRADFRSDDAHAARLKRHDYWVRDLRRYGLVVVEIDAFAEIDELMDELERRVARRRIWVSGSWPLDAGDSSAGFVHDVARAVGRRIGSTDLFMLSGAGLLVGSASLSGFLETMQGRGEWDFDRRLVVRPFPQPVGDAEPDRQHWAELRSELARLAGIVVFVGGAKIESGGLVSATGVLEERALADDRGAFLLPVGATGGAASVIADELLTSALPSTGSNARRPTDDELRTLSDASATPDQLADAVLKIVKRISR